MTVSKPFGSAMIASQGMPSPCGADSPDTKVPGLSAPQDAYSLHREVEKCALVTKGMIWFRLVVETAVP